MTNDQSFGAWLKRRRKALDLTQEQLARQVGCAMVTLSKFETGERRPSKQLVELLLDVLEVEQQERSHLLRIARRVPDEPARPAPSSRVVVSSHVLPTELTSFIGREEAIATISMLLGRTELRALTLLGSGGVGKTRLAVNVGNRVKGQFADGVFFIQLAPITDLTLVPALVAAALGIKPTGKQTEHALLSSYLQQKELLLILDNAEQLPGLAGVLADWLRSPRVKVLVTSRTLLRFSGEQIYQVPPLALPDLRDPPPFAQLMNYAALRLFIERVQTVRPTFVVTPERALVLARICARLDGLPLAIELAAARIRVLSPEVMLEQLEHGIDILKRTAHDRPARHQTLRQTIDWSYQLLGPRDQALIVTLSVFVDGCSGEAAAAVIGGEQLAIFEGLESLIEQSMLFSHEEPDGTLRFGMLETIREYAQERLAARDDVVALRTRHAAYYTDLVRQAEPALGTAQQQRWLDRLESDHNNVRAALRTQLERGDIIPALQLASSIWKFWQFRSYHSEGRRWLQELLHRDTHEDTRSEPERHLLHSAQAKASWALGWLSLDQGDYRAAGRAFERSLALAESLPDHLLVGLALQGCGEIAVFEGDYQRARDSFSRSLAIFRTLGNTEECAWALDHLGRLARSEREPGAAEAMHIESLALFQKAGHAWGIAIATNHLAEVLLEQGQLARVKLVVEPWLAQQQTQAGPRSMRLVTSLALTFVGTAELFQGRLNEAEALLQQSLTMSREEGYAAICELNQDRLGRVELERGNSAAAAQYFLQSLNLVADLEQAPTQVLRLLEGAAAVIAAHRNAADAAALYGAAQHLRATQSLPQLPLYQAWYTRLHETLHAHLAPAALATARHRGSTLSSAEAVDLARRLLAELMNHEGIVK